MPSLEWIGKEKVVNHHLEVPYHVLKRKYSYDEEGQHEADNGSENMIIHGDNLLALKSLLPKYEGRISCIYIDPPYNTGNEGWVYNDNVNDPRIKKWLGEVVGKEGDDLSRHDKWLCMMYPRLKLLHRLLSQNGSIWISIDDDECHYLKILLDDIFGRTNFIADVIWEKKYAPQNDAKWLSDSHDFIIVYAKNKNIWRPNLLSRTAEMNARYKNPDNDARGPWKASDFSVRTYSEKNDYPITLPSGRIVNPPKGRCWGSNEEEFLILKQDNRIWFGENGDNVPARKKFLTEVKQGSTCKTIWFRNEVGDNQSARQEVKKILKEQNFDTPKPTELIARILQLATDKDSIVLDSFAGSGTTAHAVLDMNAKDGGQRHFILVEMEDYADSITAERVKRVIHGYPVNKKEVLYDTAITTRNIKDGAALFADAKDIADQAKETYDKVEGPKVVEGHLQVLGIEKAKENQKGTGGDFSFYELGAPLFQGEALNAAVDISTIREYVYFMETRQPLPDVKAAEPYYLGSYVGTAYYFCYEAEEATTLNRAFLHTIQTKADHYVIYADRCTLSEAELSRFHMTFKKIPRDMARL